MSNISSTGKVIGIYIAPRRGEPTIAVEKIHVTPGMGIRGDRYFRTPGAQKDDQKTGWEITLIEMEAIDSMMQDGIQISPGQTRRNIITQGTLLNDLVGKVFFIGNIQLHGIRLCEPCDYLASLTDPRLKQSMTHRGGLRADILTEGDIQINDPILISIKE